VDKTSKPESCPHQMTAVVEARIVETKRTHPAWGPRTSAPISDTHDFTAE